LAFFGKVWNLQTELPKTTTSMVVSALILFVSGVLAGVVSTGADYATQHLL
jgi:hypothetical protein